MSAPYFPKRIVIATRLQRLMARLFGRKIASIEQQGMDIYAYRGCFYVTAYSGGFAVSAWRRDRQQ